MIDLPSRSRTGPKQKTVPQDVPRPRNRSPRLVTGYCYPWGPLPSGVGGRKETRTPSKRLLRRHAYHGSGGQTRPRGRGRDVLRRRRGERDVPRRGRRSLPPDESGQGPRRLPQVVGDDVGLDGVSAKRETLAGRGGGGRRPEVSPTATPGPRGNPETRLRRRPTGHPSPSPTLGVGREVGDGTDRTERRSPGKETGSSLRD